MKRILVVDDDPAILEAVVSLLSETYDVATARDGMEALQKLKKEKFKIVVMDLLMPKMDGATLLGEMTQAKIELPVVVMTASSNCGTLLRDKKYSVLIRKPFKIEDLEKLISKHIA